MQRHLLAAAALASLATAAHADGLTLVGIGGTCRILQIAGTSVPCASSTKLFYTQLPNGTILYNVALADDRVLGFIGERDSQPTPEDYTLYLSRVRLAKGSDQGDAVTVTGTCKSKLSTDGSIVYSVVCTASDDKGHHFEMNFVGDERPVDIKHL